MADSHKNLSSRQKSKDLGYRIYRMYSDRQAWVNSVDPDETPQNAASHQGTLPLNQQFLHAVSGIRK